MTRDEWAELGRTITEARAEQRDRATRALASRALADLELLFEGRPAAPPLLAALGEQLAEVSFEDWARLGSRDVAEVLTEVEVWRKLDDTWQWANQEEEPGEDAWACFLDGLREDLEPLRDELQAQAAEVAAGQERFDAAATLGLWPLEYAGQSRAVHAEALDAIAERMGIPRSEMLDVESIEDEPLFVLSDEAHAIEALADALAARIAWARASHRLSLPRSAAPVVDG